MNRGTIEQFEMNRGTIEQFRCVEAEITMSVSMRLALSFS